MMSAVITDSWTDVLDPTPEELDALLPESIHGLALEELLRPCVHDDEPRPRLEVHGDYVFGVFPVMVVEPDGGRYYLEVDVVLTHDRLITVRKTPTNGAAPYECKAVHDACRSSDSLAMIVYRLVDDVAERYLDVVDALDEAIEMLEDGVEEWDAATVRRRVSDIRRDILEIRRTLGPFRDLTRRVVDNRLELQGEEEIFTREVEISFGAAHDKFMRASDGLEVARDLLAGVRDYYQTLLSNRQNEIGQRMAAIASMLLLPTFIVGLYGQNFATIPELGWHFGYAYSWGLIVGVTVLQYVYFHRKGWL
jgi:magnesium transporter